MEVAVVIETPASEVRERLVVFVGEVAGGLSLARQRENALVYVRGLVERGGRKSLQPTLFRLGESPARYESVQQFLADSPWDAALLVRACAERVAPEIGVLAWVVDDTGIVKDGRHSPGVKRQYSGTLGKIGNCQITVSVHAVGARGTLPLGWRRYLPEEWCDDLPRRHKAKIPDGVCFRTKPELAVGMCEQAAGWEIPVAPILADCAYGDDTCFRTKLDAQELEYVLAVSAQISVYGPETTFRCPSQRHGRAAAHGRPPRPEARIGACPRRTPADQGVADAALPDDSGGRGRLEPFRLRPRRCHQPGQTICSPGRARGTHMATE